MIIRYYLVAGRGLLILGLTKGEGRTGGLWHGSQTEKIGESGNKNLVCPI